MGGSQDILMAVPKISDGRVARHSHGCSQDQQREGRKTFSWLFPRSVMGGSRDILMAVPKISDGRVLLMIVQG